MNENPLKVAEKWYSTDEIRRRIHKANDSLGLEEKIPEDIYSEEFAEWLTKEFQHAMTKGIQLAGAE